jgi:hypothetical protein
MINLDDFGTEVANLGRGETVRVNHTECPAGQDMRRRLYITRPAGSPEIVLGYCHNCQDKGVWRSDAPSAYRQFDDDAVSTIQLSGDDFAPPPNLVEDVEDWPVEATAWRIQKRVTPQDCESVCIAYDPATHRIYLPMWNRIPHGMSPDVGKPELIGYQLRRLTDRGAKYLTAIKDKTRQPSTVIDPKPPDSTDVSMAILVEDLASGLALSNALELSGYNGPVLVNYGTKVTPEVLHRVTDFKLGIVWLDNDSVHVVNQAHKIAKVWRMLSGALINVEDGDRDPKALDPKEIIEVVSRNWNG